MNTRVLEAVAPSDRASEIVPVMLNEATEMASAVSDVDYSYSYRTVVIYKITNMMAQEQGLGHLALGVGTVSM